MRNQCSDFELLGTYQVLKRSMEHRRPPVRLVAPLIGAMSFIGGCTLVGGGEGQKIGQSTTTDVGRPDVMGTAVPAEATASDDPPRQLRRLSNREYNNAVRDLLGDDSRPADGFIDDVYQNGFDNGSVGLAVQSDQAFAYQSAAETLAARAVASSMDRLIGGCDVAGQGDAACEDAFVATFAPRAYRRPLTTSETRRLRDMFHAGEAVGGFAVGIQTALELILQSPQFLYREELGIPDIIPVSGTAVRLTDYETASELSFLITGSIADDELWSAAQQGRLTTADDRRRQAERLLATDGAKETLRGFLHQWLGTLRLADVSKDPNFYPTWSRDMAASMTGELDRFYDASLFTGDASLRGLFTSNTSFADATMADLYGVPITGDGFQPITLDPEARKGILSRAGFLAAHAAADSSGPISRGVFVLEAILCSAPPPPPPDVPRAMPAGDPAAQNLTTRQRFDEHVSDARCAGCHRAIDGIGFGFEAFDGIGAYRTTEKGRPVDSSGTIVGAGEIDGDYDGLGELATRVAGSQRLVDCYLRHAYRYAMGQIEPAQSSTTDLLASLHQGFSPDAKLVEALLTVVADPRFASRRFE
jgi:hypothetical protein